MANMPPRRPRDPAPDRAPYFDGGFAFIALIIVIVLAAVTWAGLGAIIGRFALTADWDAFGARTKLAAFVSIPALILGSLMVLVGLWMALVEWRGRFVRRVEEEEFEYGTRDIDVPSVVEAVGKLRGAALAMVVGASLILASAWVASSAPQPTTPPAVTAPAATP